MLYQPKLCPHPHTGRVLPHSHTSYGALFFIVLLVGMLLLGVTETSHADNVTVQAVVLGTAPTQPPTIQFPINAQHFLNLPTNIRGTCTPGLLVNVYRNDVLSGSALCDQTGHFNIQSDLFIGQNDLVANQVNSGNQTGPNSTPVTAYYDLPSTPANFISSSGPGSNGNVVIKAQSIYKGTVPGQQLTWPIEIIGGVAPYAVSVDWGDGTTDLFSKTGPGGFSISHTYKKVGGYKGGYVMQIKAVDADGTSALLQLVGIVNNEVGAATTSPLSISSYPWWHLLVAWPLWLALLLVLLSFWLGDWQGRRHEDKVLGRDAPPPPLPTAPAGV